MRFIHYFFVPLFALLIVGCGVQKRHYQRGYYVQKFHHKNSQIELSGQEKTATAVLSKLEAKPNVVYASSEKIVLSANELKKEVTPPDSCDVLLFRDGSEITVKISEVTANEVKYKRCDNLSGPTFVSRRSDLFMIKYANGTREILKEEAPSRTSPSQTNPNSGRPSGSISDEQMNPNAPAALVSGILSFVSFIAGFFFPYLMITAVLSAITAITSARRYFKQDRAQSGAGRGKGMAIAGLVVAIVTLSIIFIALLFFVLLLLLI